MVRDTKNPKPADLRVGFWAGLLMLAVAGAVGAGLFLLSRPPPDPSPQQRTAHLMELLRQGKVTGAADAVELGDIIARAIFVNNGAAPDRAERNGSKPITPLTARDMAAVARAAFAEAGAQLAQDPNPAARRALEAAAAAASRSQGVEQLWTIAQSGDSSSGAAARAVGALMTALSDRRAIAALEVASGHNPQDARIWRLQSYAFNKPGEVDEARGAALVASGLEQAASGLRDQAEALFSQALPLVRRPPARAFLVGLMGDFAAEDQDFRTAARRYREAIALHAQGDDLGALSLDASKLARVQIALGNREGACATLTEAQRDGATVTPVERAAACAPVSPPVSAAPGAKR